MTVRPAGTEVRIGFARASDAPEIAELHAQSWRRHYRGAYSDRYLDTDVFTDRLAVWTERMSDSDATRLTLVARSDTGLVGFAHVVLDADRRWGALVDNLHVAHRLQRSGLGTRLLDAAARHLKQRRPGSGLFLWVLEKNEAAQAFYRARHGLFCDRTLAPPPGGDPGNLNGPQWKFRVAWPDPAVVIGTRREEPRSRASAPL